MALRTDPQPRETYYAFVGRLAAVNGVSLQDFLNDFGLPKNGFFALHGDVVDAIAQLADLNQAQVKELVTWTGLPQEGVRMAYRGEQIVSRAIRNPEVRGCPDCLRRDAKGALEPLTAMAMRGHWLLRHCHVCLLHGKMLVPLWSVTRPSVRDDVQAQLAKVFPTIIDGQLTGAVIAPSAFDNYIL
ncbi:TniQ family protein [Loktanella fryxellensis]|uniref:TniQ family protein n=1 Tax=Loktanella fryxellensis TaxID=245187 RepID=UPI0015A6B077|nr:TniQ family protein [Loktanella fryxellensis]